MTFCLSAEHTHSLESLPSLRCALSIAKGLASKLPQYASFLRILQS